nr:MAG TPA: hypothetical protein [Caudoviricetes sp.]
MGIHQVFSFCPGAWRKTVLICPCDVKRRIKT